MIAEIVTHLERHMAATPGRNCLVGISGIDGSGKSTLASNLARHLTDHHMPAVQVELDDFLHPREIRHRNDNQVAGYFDENFDFDCLIHCILEPAKADPNIRTKRPVLDLETDQISTQLFDFTGPGFLIVEGVFLFRKELRDWFDLKIWIDIDFDTAMDRVVNRSRDSRYGDADAIRHRYDTRFFPTQRFHIQRDDPAGAADIVLTAA